MIAIIQKYHRLFFYCTWFLLGLAQSASTELLADEAYYWVYSKYLSWGYFDHPPMIALLIKWGTAVFQNEPGVRIFCVLLNTLTILLIEKLVEKRNPFLFYAIILSLGILQIGGFLAVPDTPMLFFTALFFYCYKKFAGHGNWKNAVVLGLVIALLFYSKYHGLLIVALTFLSNLKLLFRWQTWLAALAALVFFAPHLLWQWEHNWVSFRYHLFESNVSEYKISYTTDYLLGQLLLAGPLIGLIILPAAFLYKPVSDTERALKFTMIGVYLIFLISSFRGKVEANWPLPALIALVVLGHQYIIQRMAWLKAVRIAFVVSLVIIAAGRIYLAVDLGPDNAVKRKFHGGKKWAETVASKTAGLPVVFYNSYQRASLFWFYGKRSSHSLNDFRQRRNNYNLWPTEDSLLGKPVYIADVYDMHLFSDSVKTGKTWTGWKYDSLFVSLGKIRVVPSEKTFSVNAGDSIRIRCSLSMPGHYSSFLKQYPELETELLFGVFNSKGFVQLIPSGITAQDLYGVSDFDLVISSAGLKPGKYFFRLAISSQNYPPTHNSEKYSLIIK